MNPVLAQRLHLRTNQGDRLMHHAQKAEAAGLRDGADQLGARDPMPASTRGYVQPSSSQTGLCSGVVMGCLQVIAQRVRQHEGVVVGGVARAVEQGHPASSPRRASADALAASSSR